MSARARIRELGRPVHDFLWMAHHTPACTLMNRYVTPVRPDAGADVVAALLLEHGFPGVPVVDETGEPIGIVTAADLLRHRYECGDTTEDATPLKHELRWGFHVHTITAATAGDVMAPVALAIPETMPLTTVAAMMAYDRALCAPVVSRKGKVVGLLSAVDVLRWLAQADGDPRGGRP